MAKQSLPDFSTSEIGKINDPVDRFFAYARERQSILLKKNAGLPRPWTTDPILNYYKFCNVFREDDKTTKWFRENVRDPWKNDPEVFLATVIFRWFNRIETGEIVFCQTEFWGESLFDRFLKQKSIKEIENEIRYQNPHGKWVTGAYIITSPPGFDKLEGICHNIDYFIKSRFPWKGSFLNWEEVAGRLHSERGQHTLKDVWDWLRQVPYLGTFHSYEMVTDMRHTALLDKAPDVCTWANVGPGAKRGLNAIHNREPKSSIKNPIEEMIQLLELSRNPHYWLNNQAYPPWELRDVEHTLCEVWKYEKVVRRIGKPRSIYR